MHTRRKGRLVSIMLNVNNINISIFSTYLKVNEILTFLCLLFDLLIALEILAIMPRFSCGWDI
jgi:hypothetical protein